MPLQDTLVCLYMRRRQLSSPYAVSVPPLAVAVVADRASFSPKAQLKGFRIKVPDDIWNMIFRLLFDSGKSVLNVSLSCRRFYILTLPLLFKRLSFHHDRNHHAETLCELVQKRRHLQNYVQSVDINCITWNDAHLMVASFPPPCIVQLLGILTNLQSVSLSGTVLSYRGALLLAETKTLRQFSISSSCRLGKNMFADIPRRKNHSIERLTIGELAYDKPEDLVDWLYLVLSNTLTDLHVIGGLTTGKFFIESLLQELVLNTLRRLHIEYIDGAILYEIVARQQRLEELHFFCSDPLFVVDSRLPPNISSWSGPAFLATHFIPDSEINKVRLWMQDMSEQGRHVQDKPLAWVYETSIKHARRPIQSLEILHFEWNQCLMDSIPRVFPDLERLALFFIDRPDMDYLENKLAAKLAMMKHLRYLSMGTEGTIPAVRPANDIPWCYNNLLKWTENCPTLKQVECRVLNLWIDWRRFGHAEWKGFMKGEMVLDERELLKLHIYPS
ncbi:hypothetical protein DACRYDRAFT_25056, partial [Dacryopinax primogenitus]